MNYFRRCKEERETIVLFDEASHLATVETSNKRMQRKLITLAEKYPNDFVKTSEQEYLGNDKLMRFMFPKRYVTISAPRKHEPNEVQVDLTELYKRIQNRESKAPKDTIIL